MESCIWFLDLVNWSCDVTLYLLNYLIHHAGKGFRKNNFEGRNTVTSFLTTEHKNDTIFVHGIDKDLLLTV